MINKINKMMNKFHNMTPAAKSSFALIVAKFFQKGLAMITSPVFTRIMPQAEYGIISTFISWQSVIYIIATLNMSQGVFNNGMIDYKKDRDGFTCSILGLANLCTITLAVIYLVFYRWLSPLIDMPDVLMVLLFIYCLFTPAYNYWMGRQRFEYKYKAITAVMIVSSIISTGLSVILVLLADNSDKAIAKLIGSESILIIVSAVLFIVAWKNVKGKINFGYWRYALKYNLPLIPHYLSMYVLSSSDRIMISKLIGSAQTAIYNVAYTVASILLIFWNSIDAAYAPWIYQNMDEGKTDAIKKRGNQVLILFFGATILSTLFAPEIMAVLAPASYRSGIYAIPAVAAGVYFTAVYSLYMRIELYLKKMHTVTIGTVGAAFLNIILNGIFIPIFGYYAAAYTTLFCYMLLALFHYINLRRLGYGYVYNNKFVLKMSVLMLVCIAGILMIYKFTVIRLILIVLFGIVLVIKRKQVVELIKSNKR